MIRFESVTKRFGDGTVAVDELRLEAPSGKITVLRRSVRLRQDHLAAHDQPDDRPDLGTDHARRQGHREDRSRPSCAAASAT